MSTSYKTLDPNELSVSERQTLLTTAIAPRPICFASTVDKDGKVNLSPYSFFNVFSSNPPVMVFSPARRGRDNTTKHTYENIKDVPEVVINVVNYPMAEQMSLASAEYARGVNEFEKSGFTAVPSEKVRPPRVGESPVAFECTVDKVIELGQEGGAGNLVIARVELIHLNEDYLNEEEQPDPASLDLIGRMGGSWYTRASGDSLFQIPKPLKRLGIGVDQLPKSIRNSKVLTGNNLGRLGNLENLPGQDEIKEVKDNPQIAALLESRSGDDLIIQLHKHAQQLLDAGESEKALAVLMIPVS